MLDGATIYGPAPFAAPASSASVVRQRARPSLPSHEQLMYAKEAMIVVLLALAFPWLIARLLTNPASVMAAIPSPVK